MLYNFGRQIKKVSIVQRRWCGIIACLEFGENEALSRCSPQVVEKAVKKISHRGPDGQGYVAGYGWALGHARLAIVAPNEEAAAQPFHLAINPENGLIMDAVETKHTFESIDLSKPLQPEIACAANGEIYTHKELFQGLQGKPTGHSDCEVVPHLYAELGPAETAKRLIDAGMFAFALIDAREPLNPKLYAARDPTGIKPLYYGVDRAGRICALASELKGLQDIPGIIKMFEFPNGHYLYQHKFYQYYQPHWAVPNFSGFKNHSIDEIRQSLDQAVEKRMMSDVAFGLFLSGGIDSCIVAQLMLNHHRKKNKPNATLPSFTVGMENSPDLMAARAMAKELGTEHNEKIFTIDEALSVIDQVVYHMETYNAELIRSAIPNWFLAQLAAKQVKMVLTGEGADELWAGYAYFADAPNPSSVHQELIRIYNFLGKANLLRTDRITSAHSLEARVPFLDTQNTSTAMEIHPRLKHTAGVLGPKGEPGEKMFLRKCFERQHGGVTIPKDLLYRAKAMQCEGTGPNLVASIQNFLSSKVSDHDFAHAHIRFPHETPQSKEEYYYRHIFDSFYPDCDHVPTLWPGGYRAGGAKWRSLTYTRHGRNDLHKLAHALQQEETREPSSISSSSSS
mmetsp:Transcript_2363/g.3147  ORF Transcript_2363/g.3147 Transcript_2363/m.3147 type:complete len:623 (-) Transcript_2363:270-2138(-)